MTEDWIQLAQDRV